MSASKKGLSNLLRKFEGLKLEGKERKEDIKNDQNLLENLEIRRKSSGLGSPKHEKTNNEILNAFARNLNSSEEVKGNINDVIKTQLSPKRVAFSETVKDKQPQGNMFQKRPLSTGSELNVILKINDLNESSHSSRLSPTPSPRSSTNLSENIPIPAPRRRKRAIIQITEPPKRAANQTSNTLFDQLNLKANESNDLNTSEGTIHAQEKSLIKPVNKSDINKKVKPNNQEEKSLNPVNQKRQEKGLSANQKTKKVEPKPANQSKAEVERKIFNQIPPAVKPKPVNQKTAKVEPKLVNQGKEEVESKPVNQGREEVEPEPVKQNKAEAKIKHDNQISPVVKLKPVNQKIAEVEPKSVNKTTTEANLKQNKVNDKSKKSEEIKMISQPRENHTNKPVVRQKSLKATKININKRPDVENIPETKSDDNDKTQNIISINPVTQSSIKITKLPNFHPENTAKKEETKIIDTQPQDGAREQIVKIKDQQKNVKLNLKEENLQEEQNRQNKEKIKITKEEEERQKAIDEEQKYVQIIEEEERLNKTKERSRSIHLEVQGAFVVNESTMTSQESKMAAVRNMMTSPKRALNSVKRSMSVRKQRKSAPNFDEGFDEKEFNEMRKRTSSQNNKTLKHFSPGKKLNSVKRSMSLKMRGLRPKSTELKENKLAKVFQKPVTSGSTGSFHVDDVSGVLLNLNTRRRRNREGGSAGNSPGLERRNPAETKLSSRSFKLPKNKPKRSYASGSRTLGTKEFEEMKTDWRPKFGILKGGNGRALRKPRRSADVGDWDKVSDFGGMDVDFRRTKSTNDQLLNNEYNIIDDKNRATSWDNNLDVVRAIEQENEYQFIDEVFADIIKQDNSTPLGYDRAQITKFRAENDLENQKQKVNPVIKEEKIQEIDTLVTAPCKTNFIEKIQDKTLAEDTKNNETNKSSVPEKRGSTGSDTLEIYDEVARDEVQEESKSNCDVTNDIEEKGVTESEDIYDQVPDDENCEKEVVPPEKMDTKCELNVPQILISPRPPDVAENILPNDVQKDENLIQSPKILPKTSKKQEESSVTDVTDEYVTMASQSSDVSNDVTPDTNVVTNNSTYVSQKRIISPLKLQIKNDKNMEEKFAENAEETEERRSAGLTGLFSRFLTPKRERKLGRNDSKKLRNPKEIRTPSPKTPTSKKEAKQIKRDRKSKKKTKKQENTLQLPEYSPSCSKSSDSSYESSPQFQKVLFSSVTTNRGSEILLFDEQNLSENYVRSQLEQTEQIYDQPPSDVANNASDVMTEQIYDQTPDDVTNDDNNNDFRKLLDEIKQKNEAKRKSNTSLKIYDDKYVTSSQRRSRNSKLMTSYPQNGGDIIIYDIPNDPPVKINEWYQVPTSIPIDDVTTETKDDVTPRDTDLINVFDDVIYDETPQDMEKNSPIKEVIDTQTNDVIDIADTDVIYDETPTEMDEAIYDQTPDDLEPESTNLKPNEPDDEPIYSQPPLEENSPPNSPMVSALTELVTSLRTNSRKSSSSVSISSFEDNSDANDEVFNSSLNASLYSLPPLEQTTEPYNTLHTAPPGPSAVEYDDPKLLGNHLSPTFDSQDYQEIESDDDYVNVTEVKAVADKKELLREERAHSGATPRRAPQVTFFSAYDTLNRAPPSPSLIRGDYAKYGKVLEIAHGECALSVPYVAVNRTPGTEAGPETAGEIYVSDCNGDCIDVYDNNGKHKSSINMPGYPRGIASYTSRHILCASCGSSKIFVVDVNKGNILRKIGKRAGLRNPRCVTMHPDNQSFMTSDIRHLHNWSLKLFDIRTGDVANSITSTKNLDLKIGWPEFITYRQNSDHQFYVSDSESNCCFAYDARKNTRPTMTIGKQGTNNGEMINPCGIAYLSGGKLTLNSAEGSLLVSDWGNNRVSAYDGTNGMFQCHVIDRKADGLSTPYDLKVDTTGAIYLSESETSNIKVYKII